MDKRTKLTPAKVRSIRNTYDTGRKTQTEIAMQFGVSQQHVSKIVLGLRRDNVA